jgi:type IV pilus assembly protein PilY1
MPIQNHISIVALAASLVLPWTASFAQSQMLQAPIVASAQTAPPLVLLTMSRDEKLIAPAYSDYSDIDGDGIVDINYITKVDFTYFGNFSSQLCYDYDTSNNRFNPVSTTTNKKCSGRWSGDFLNYVTSSRLDALRKSLYGGKRYIDDPYLTVLERAYVPQDSHVWGKEYDPARDTYSISDYTPLPQPATGRRHLFANVTRRLDAAQLPMMRVLTNRTERIWNWVLKEQPVAENNSLDDINGTAVAVDYIVRNVVCRVDNASLRDNICKQYPGTSVANGPSYKPTGVLHDFGESRALAFGLLSGSWANWRKGGVLRRNVDYFDSEIVAATGQFNTSVLGIVRSIDQFRVAQFGTNGSYSYNCSPANSTNPTGNCVDWANPVAEMMYEGLRYLAGGLAPTAAYGYGTGSIDASLGLKTETWKSPWRSAATGGFPYCSKPIQMVVSDIKPSFDSDDLPGSAFSGFSGNSDPPVVTGLNVSSQANTIWSIEGLGTAKYFIGESLANTPSYDQSPSLKTVNSFNNIRGLAPEGPTRQGSYYAASVARYGKTTNLNTNATQTPRNVDTYAIALSTPLPQLNIPIGQNIVSILPVGQSVAGCNYGGFESGVTFPTNRITGFYITRINNMPGFPSSAANGGRPTGQFRVGFEDNEEGTDNDMDAIVIYNFDVTAQNTLRIELNAEYAAGCIGQHLGFVISGSTEDGKYLGVRDPDTPCSDDKLFPNLGDDVANSSRNTNITNPSWIDAAHGQANVCRNGSGVPTGLGTRYVRTFTPSGNNTGGNIPKDPLWYAVKHGGPKAPAVTATDPEGYFLVTNPALLRDQLTSAFTQIFTEARGSRSTTRFTGTTVRSSTKIFKPRYDGNRWVGVLDAFPLDPNTGLAGATRAWSTFDQPALNPTSKTDTAWQARRIITRISGTYQEFEANSGSSPALNDSTLVAALALPALQSVLAKNQKDTATDVINYLRGDRSNEVIFSGKLRSRGAIPANTSDPTAGLMLNSVLGDIVNSSITFQGKQDFGFAATKVTGATSYAAYVNGKGSKTPVVYVGANDGMLHAFDERTGQELWAFIPRALHSEIAKLAQAGYTHRYFVDGAIQVSDYYSGGWKTVLVGTAGAGAKTVFAIDVTNPTSPAVLWEYDNQQIPALGFVLGMPQVIADSSNNWIAMFGNGYESSSTTPASAALIAIPVSGSGSPRVVSLPAGSVTTGDGLAAVTIAARSGFANIAWAGDLSGRLWRFNVSGAYTSWSADSSPAFRTPSSAQPITTAPAIVPSRNGGYLLYFGTGKFFARGDADNRDIQSFYGILDDGGSTILRSNLRPTTISSQGTKRLLTQGAPVAGSKGFYIDLVVGTALGERVIASPLVLFGNALFNTVIANTADVCSPSISGYQMATDFDGGGSPPADVFGATTGPGGANYGGQLSDGNLGGVSAINTLSGTTVVYFSAENPIAPTTTAGALGGGQKCPPGSKQIGCPGPNTAPLGRRSWRQIF